MAEKPPEIISRAEARERGLKYYFGGKACRHGHITARLVSNRHCVECERKRKASEGARAYMRERRKINREKTRTYMREWRALNRERTREYSRKYTRKLQADCPERVRAKVHRWRVANSDKARVAVHRWRKNNPEKNRSAGRKRRAHRMNAPGTHTIADITRLFILQNGVCAECQTWITLEPKQPNTRHVDHMVALSRGGSDGPENLRLLCPHCNTSKCNKTVHEHKVWKVESTQHLASPDGVIVRQRNPNFARATPTRKIVLAF